MGICRSSRIGDLCSSKSVSQSWVNAYDSNNNVYSRNNGKAVTGSSYVNHQRYRRMPLDSSMTIDVSKTKLIPRSSPHFPSPPNSSSSTSTGEFPPFKARRYHAADNVDNIRQLSNNERSQSIVSESII